MGGVDQNVAFSFPLVVPAPVGNDGVIFVQPGVGQVWPLVANLFLFTFGKVSLESKSITSHEIGIIPFFQQLPWLGLWTFLSLHDALQGPSTLPHALLPDLQRFTYKEAS